jgi:hypothetical protein
MNQQSVPRAARRSALAAQPHGDGSERMFAAVSKSDAAIHAAERRAMAASGPTCPDSACRPATPTR